LIGDGCSQAGDVGAAGADGRVDAGDEVDCCALDDLLPRLLINMSVLNTLADMSITGDEYI